MTSSTPNVGELLTEVPQRDAIHVAIAPVVATEPLRPGQHIGFIVDNERVGSSGHPIGIVDPFLTAPVQAGQWFWMFLYPNTVTSMRHEWAHAAFAKVDLTAAGVEDERRGFLNAIAASPDDDGLRKIFADWLDERGEHAEAVRQRDWKAIMDASRRWLRDFAEANAIDYDDLLASARSGAGICFGDDSGPEAYWLAKDEFWKHMEIVTGATFTESHRENTGFRCAC